MMWYLVYAAVAVVVIYAAVYLTLRWIFPPDTKDR